MNLTLPLPPNLANARFGHWAKRKKAADAYFTRCLLAHPLLPSRTIERCKVVATLYVWHLSDPDNLTARLKWPLDFLTSRGFLKDDSPRVITDLVVRQQVDRTNQRLEVELHEA